MHCFCPTQDYQRGTHLPPCTLRSAPPPQSRTCRTGTARASGPAEAAAQQQVEAQHTVGRCTVHVAKAAKEHVYWWKVCVCAAHASGPAAAAAQQQVAAQHERLQHSTQVHWLTGALCVGQSSQRTLMLVYSLRCAVHASGLVAAAAQHEVAAQEEGAAQHTSLVDRCTLRVLHWTCACQSCVCRSSAGGGLVQLQHSVALQGLKWLHTTLVLHAAVQLLINSNAC
jgi:hypothetical protein